MGTVKRSGLQSVCSHAAWRCPTVAPGWPRRVTFQCGAPGCSKALAEKEWRAQPNSTRESAAAGARLAFLCKLRLERDARPGQNVETRGRFTRGRPEGRDRRGQRDLREGEAWRVGVPASCGAPDSELESAAARSDLPGCVLWSSTQRLLASSPSQQSLSQTPRDWTRSTTSGLEVD